MRPGMPRVSATSTKISGSSGICGWKKAKQRRSAGSRRPLQIVPVADLVHRLVADDLLEDVGGRRPVDAPQHQEAAVEPRREEMHEIGVDRCELRVHLDARREVPRACDQRRGAAGREVDPAEQFLPARLGRDGGAGSHAAGEASCLPECHGRGRGASVSGPGRVRGAGTSRSRSSSPIASQRRAGRAPSATPEASPRVESRRLGQRLGRQRRAAVLLQAQTACGCGRRGPAGGRRESRAGVPPSVSSESVAGLASPPGFVFNC